ncbi:Lin 24 like family member [Plakobranchus ocellatus]|uniref:Lin 24 like family member n=1 Tax=Plakobranchus ocellatus TaxID=259542 RepID=A0AAV4A0Y9_9GAST|nr:Lin 24 like family member [Plakobranchus ocellatus]
MATKVVDLDEKVIKWAWSQFEIAREKEHKHLKFKDIGFTINWDRVRFIPSIPKYTEKKQLAEPKPQVVFKSVYENRTEQIQEHQFETNRTTVSSCNTNITRGFTRGLNLELKLALPEEIVSATAGFGRELTMEKSQDWTQEETVSWSINSTIKVRPKYRTVAELVVKEQEFNANFTMSARIRGVVVVTLTNLRDNNSFIDSIENEFVEVAREIRSEQGDGSQFKIEGNTVVWELTGTCSFRYGIEQHVQLDESPIVPTPKKEKHGEPTDQQGVIGTETMIT